MHGWLIYKQEDYPRNHSYIDWFIAEGKKQDLDIALILRERITIGIIDGQQTILLDGKPCSLPRFAIVRTIEPLLQYFFEAHDIATFNDFSVSMITNDKRLTYLEMEKLDIPMLTTLFYAKDNLPHVPPLPYPFVIKDAYGRSGKNMYYIASDRDWETVSVRLNSEHIIVQDAAVRLGNDLRVFVVGKEIIAAVLRSNKHDFRANYSLGGEATLYTLSDEETAMIKKIVHHFNFGMVGIDFLLSTDGKLLFNEIEDVVGSRILSATTEINILEKYVSFIKKSIDIK